MTPSKEFRSMHMRRTGLPKRSYRTPLGGWLHKRSLVRRTKIGANRLQVYPCWFTDENTFGRKHWHVGHAPQSGYVKHATLSKARLKAALEDGYRLSVVLSERELARLEEMAPPGMPVQQFAARAIIGLARTGRLCCHVDPSGCLLEVSKNSRRETAVT